MKINKQLVNWLESTADYVEGHGELHVLDAVAYREAKDFYIKHGLEKFVELLVENKTFNVSVVSSHMWHGELDLFAEAEIEYVEGLYEDYDPDCPFDLNHIKELDKDILGWKALIKEYQTIGQHQGQ
tara:strand:+ start:261 stop:641 length:381 start_codon:yes stop_codon:yes gene_type:complete